MSSLYRKCVGIVIMNHEKKIFAGSRIDFKSNHWQMPQGGVDDGENYLDAAYRELEEETSITKDKVKLLAKTSNDLYYDLPDDIRHKIWNGKYKGQVQKWYLFEFLGNETQDIDIHNVKMPEFNKYKWSTSSEIIDEIVPFKKEIYIKVINEFKNYLK